MSPVPTVGGFHLDNRSRSTLRLALGATATLAIGFAIEWPLSFVSAVIIWMVLKHPEPGYGVRDGLAFIGSLFRGLLCGLIVGSLFGQSPVILFLMLTLILFLTYYAFTGGADQYSVLFMLVGNTAIPLFATKSVAVASAFAFFLFEAAAFGVLIAILAYGLFPEPDDGHDHGHGASGPPPTQAERIESATRSVLVMMPLVICFYTFQWAGMFLTVAYAAIISLESSGEGSLEFGSGFVKGILIGGVASVFIYYIVLAVPLYLMLMLLFLLSSLIFARQCFSDHPLGKYYALGFSTIVIVVSTATMPESDSADIKLLGRVFRIALAAIWVVGGMTLLERLRPGAAGQAVVS
jgi:hypothetical protein